MFCIKKSRCSDKNTAVDISNITGWYRFRFHYNLSPADASKLMIDHHQFIIAFLRCQSCHSEITENTEENRSKVLGLGLSSIFQYCSAIHRRIVFKYLEMLI